MKIKNISIILTILLVAIASLVIAQRSHYGSSAKETYDARVKGDTTFANTILRTLNPSLETYKGAWAFATEAVQTVKTSQDMARLEGKYFPATKGANNISKKTRTLEATADYVIVSTFDKDVMDKEAKIKILSGLKSVDVSTLMGEPLAVEEEEEVAEDEEEAEEEVEEAPAPKKAAKPAKGKKGKKGKKR